MANELNTKKRSLREAIGSHMEVFVSLAALITAVAAVVITLEQTKVMREEAELERKNARISVLPSVWLSTHIGDTEGEAYYKGVPDNIREQILDRLDQGMKDTVTLFYQKYIN